jgi:indole-3-glycerol phosphate synthase
MNLRLNEKLKEIHQVKLEEIKSIDIDSLPPRKSELRSFSEHIKEKTGLALIAEIKKASPSKGIIREDFNLNGIIKDYCSIAADAISVLTDRQFFQGHADYLKQVKEQTKIPVLRKDFIISVKQIYESYSMGADIILLIVAMLSAQSLAQLIAEADKMGLAILVEAHNRSEIDLALSAGAKMIGINNRDLNTFKVDINNALNLAPLIPEGIIKVAESGIHSNDDIKKIEQAGFDAVLIGEAFMASTDINSVYRDLFAK